MTSKTKTGRSALVTTDEGLQHALDAARSAGTMALDTEFMREKTYRARLCLVQVAALDHIFLLDPLSDLDLAGLADLLADPTVEILVHAGKQDLEIFYEAFGCVPRNVFDVQLAAAFAGFGASLPYGRLVESVLGLPLEKGESYTDWCQRPLTDAQLRYAADDVRYLPGVAQRLKGKLQELDRLTWLEEELRDLEDPEAYGIDPERVWRKVTGRGALRGHQTAVLRELALWREEAAARRDLPRGWILKDPTLIELARRTPTSTSALRNIRGLNPKEVDRSGDEILAAVERGRNAPKVEMEKAPSRSTQMRARMLAGLADALVRARCEQANIATEVLMTRSELEALLADVITGRADERKHRLLQGWRRQMAGDAVVGLASGRIALKAVDEPPYIQEVSVDGNK
ncbi:MAG TPA: ribonuclease D [Actinomycetota bacterium]|nr:ribonuclease D [Actinomycetota bacterium]